MVYWLLGMVTKFQTVHGSVSAGDHVNLTLFKGSVLRYQDTRYNQTCFNVCMYDNKRSLNCVR